MNDSNTKGHENWKPQITQNRQKASPPGRQTAEEFDWIKRILNAESATAAGGSAVVIVSLGAKDVMRKLLMQENFSTNEQ